MNANKRVSRGEMNQEEMNLFVNAMKAIAEFGGDENLAKVIAEADEVYVAPMSEYHALVIDDEMTGTDFGHVHSLNTQEKVAPIANALEGSSIMRVMTEVIRQAEQAIRQSNVRLTCQDDDKDLWKVSKDGESVLSGVGFVKAQAKFRYLLSCETCKAVDNVRHLAHFDDTLIGQNYH